MKGLMTSLLALAVVACAIPTSTLAQKARKTSGTPVTSFKQLMSGYNQAEKSVARKIANTYKGASDASAFLDKGLQAAMKAGLLTQSDANAMRAIATDENHLTIWLRIDTFIVANPRSGASTIFQQVITAGNNSGTSGEALSGGDAVQIILGSAALGAAIGAEAGGIGAGPGAALGAAVGIVVAVATDVADGDD